MVLVGYSTSGRYWLVRNSWSARWGESGYARVAMTGNGAGPCGMYQVGAIFTGKDDLLWPGVVGVLHPMRGDHHRHDRQAMASMLPGRCGMYQAGAI